MPKYFQYISRLQYGFHLAAIFLIGFNSLVKSQSSLSGVGLGVAFLGIGFTVGSLSDPVEVTTKERATFSSPKRFQRRTRSLWALNGLVFCVSLFFISIRFINPSLDPILAAQYSNLGYGCMALAFGSVFELKQVFEKRRYFLQQEGERLASHE